MDDIQRSDGQRPAPSALPRVHAQFIASLSCSRVIGMVVIITLNYYGTNDVNRVLFSLDSSTVVIINIFNIVIPPAIQNCGRSGFHHRRPCFAYHQKKGVGLVFVCEAV